MDHLGQLNLRYSGLTLRSELPHGHVYTGQEFIGTPVTVAVLGEQASADPNLRRAFAERVAGHDTCGADVHASRPWAAVRVVPGQADAAALLALDEPAAPALEGSAPPPAPVSHTPPVSRTPPARPTSPTPPTPPGAGRTAAGSRGALVGIAAAAAVVMGGLGVYFANTTTTTAPPANLAPTTAPSATVAPSPPAATPQPAAADAPLTGDAPQLRDIEPVSVIGPVFGDGDDSTTMAFAGWPFAFRTPPTWGCLRGTYGHIPDADAWQCMDERGPGTERLNVMLWACPSTCTDDEREHMIETWLDEPERAVHAGPTAYVETEANHRGHYSIDLSHFVADPDDPHGPLRWHIGVYLESPPDAPDDVLRVLNDIISQAS